MPKTKMQAQIGIFGGSGFYQLLQKPKEIIVNTPYGKPSDKIALSQIGKYTVAFLPRHGKKHQYPPHKIPYRANIWAFKKLGVQRIIAPCASGSLQAKIKPGHFVICDQFVDRTKAREDTFFDGPPKKVAHLPADEPYCPQLSRLAWKSCQKLKIPCHKKGCVVVIQGPRFSTKAESAWFTKMGWDVINMTQYPENILAREAEICYTAIALVTDYDVGLVAGKKIRPVNIEDVLKVFKKNNEKIKKVIFEMIKNMPEKRDCPCGQALKRAIL